MVEMAQDLVLVAVAEDLAQVILLVLWQAMVALALLEL
jgi:hypothetical protein